MLRSWFLPEAPWMPLGFFIHFNIAMPFSSLQLGLDWGSMRNFVTFEWNLYIFDHIVLTVSISIFWLINARGTNVRQFPTRNNFLIINILSCLSVISFYFPPLEVVHPVSRPRNISSFKSVKACLHCTFVFLNLLGNYVAPTPVQFLVFPLVLHVSEPFLIRVSFQVKLFSLFLLPLTFSKAFMVGFRLCSFLVSW